MATETRHVTTSIQGRYLLNRPDEAPQLCIVGFHGYRSNAEQLLEDLLKLRGEAPWLLCSIQGLSRFYSRSGEVIASWMTKQDREAVIQNNLEYVDRVLKSLSDEFALNENQLVFTGFSQGAAMSYRASALCAKKPIRNIIVGGDLPPDLFKMPDLSLPPTLLCRGDSDSLYPEEQFEKDKEDLTSKNIPFSCVQYEGAHEWNESLFSVLRKELIKIEHA